ncbi:MAG TPA: hypothetical protein VIX12_01360 [Candidatus Binataceae bacterium]
MNTRGGDVALNGSGTIRLAQKWRQSAIAVRFTMTPSPDARARFAFLTGLLPHPPDGRPYFLGGTIASPSLN